MVDQPAPVVNGQKLYELSRYVNDTAEHMVDDAWPREKVYAAMDFFLTGSVNLHLMRVHSNGKYYQIDIESGCSCPDSRYRSRYCKHFLAILMAQDVQQHIGADNMPTNPQLDWETKVQNGEQEPSIFEQEPTPDDIPDPQAPQPALADIERDAPTVQQAGPNHPFETSGHRYTDYPSTLCIKRHIGQTELSWTFRGTNDDEVFKRATDKIKSLDAAAQRYAPPAPVAAVPPPTQQPAPVPQATQEQTAFGAVPVCPVHQRPMKPSQYQAGQFYCTGKNPDGSYCKAKV